MNKKVIFRIFIALALYGVFALLVVMFYDDSPEKMDWDDREAFNKQYISKLSLDDVSSQKILTELGGPDITEAKKMLNDTFQIMYYRTQHVKSDGITTIEECTALLFKNGNLIAIGGPAIDQFKAKSDVNSHSS
jgi:hypothetical protein